MTLTPTNKPATDAQKRLIRRLAPERLAADLTKTHADQIIKAVAPVQPSPLDQTYDAQGLLRPRLFPGQAALTEKQKAAKRQREYARRASGMANESKKQAKKKAARHTLVTIKKQLQRIDRRITLIKSDIRILQQAA